MSEPEAVSHAQRVAAMLDEFIGLLFVARGTGTLWGVLGDKHPIAAAHATLMSEGTILITMRRFDDLWSHHVTKLLVPTDPGFEAGHWLADEIERRNLRHTASRLFAHYAQEKSDLPLSLEEATDLVQSNGWATDKEVLQWAGQATLKIGEVWAGLLAKYSLPASKPKQWILDALDSMHWIVDQAAQRFGPSEREVPSDGPTR